jgi:putative aldouronate transport system permease protein
VTIATAGQRLQYRKGHTILVRLRKDYELYLFLLPTVLFFLIFAYGPMFGLQIAFRDFNGAKGIWGSPWVGLKHFQNFFSSYYFWPLIRNTLAISIYSLLAGFPLPILLALMLNEVKNSKVKRTIQTVTYMPHFISTVVMVGMLMAFLSPSSGIINHFITLFGGDPINFIGEAKWFRHIYVLSGVWQGMGWGSIIYLAALSNVDPQLHESAVIDGASRMQCVWHINIPTILPTIVTMLILNAGSVLGVGFEKIFLMQNDLNREVSEVISTYVYQRGLIKAEYSFSTAVGLFNSVVNFLILVLVNYLSKKLSDTSLF